MKLSLKIGRELEKVIRPRCEYEAKVIFSYLDYKETSDWFDEEGVIDHLDIANHIIADKELRKPSTYRESFEVLYEERLIPKVLSDRLSDLAGFRNILVPHILEA